MANQFNDHIELHTEFRDVEVSVNKRSVNSLYPHSKYIRVRNTNCTPRGNWTTIEDDELKEIMRLIDIL